MSGLPADGFPAMTVGAADFALLDLGSEVLDCVLVEGERYHPLPSLRSDVVEFQDRHVGHPAADARGAREVVQQIPKVSPLKRPVGGDAVLEVHAPRSSGAPNGASTMTIGADDLAAIDLRLDPLQSVLLVDQEGDIGGLVSHVIELQDERVRQSAVGATGCSQQPQHTPARLGPSSLARCSRLLDVKLTAFAEVLGPAPFARALPLVELGRWEVRSTGSAASRLDRTGGGRRRRGRRPRWGDPASPQAHRGERDPERACDRTQRHSLRAKALRLALGGDLPTSHTNACSRKRQTF